MLVHFTTHSQSFTFLDLIYIWILFWMVIILLFQKYFTFIFYSLHSVQTKYVILVKAIFSWLISL